MAVVIEKMQVKLSAEYLEAVKHLEEADRHLNEIRSDMKRAAEETESWWKKNRMTLAGIAAATAGMMYAITRASPSMSIAMSQISYQFEYMAMIVGEATAPVLYALIPILEAMTEAFANMPDEVQMMIGVVIMATMVVNTMTAAMGPWGLAILAVMLAVALLYKAWQEDWGGIQEKTQAVWEVIEPIFNAIVKIFNLYLVLLELQIEAFTRLYEIVESAWKDYIEPALTAFGDALNAVFGFVSDLWNHINTVFPKIVGKIFEGVSVIVGLFMGTYNSLWWAIHSVKGAVNALRFAFQDLVTWFYDVLKGAIEDVIGWLKDLWDWICKVGDYIPGSLAKKGPFSKPAHFETYFGPSLEKSKKMIHEHLLSPITGISATGGATGGAGSSTSHIHLTQNVHLSGFAGSPFELKSILDASGESMLETFRRRVG